MSGNIEHLSSVSGRALLGLYFFLAGKACSMNRFVKQKIQQPILRPGS